LATTEYSSQQLRFPTSWFQIRRSFLQSDRRAPTRGLPGLSRQTAGLIAGTKAWWGLLVKSEKAPGQAYEAFLYFFGRLRDNLMGI
jgi:hypothetical protein